MPNVQVTFDVDPKNDRSESAIAINPRHPHNIVGASKKFTDPHAYLFSLAAYSSFDGGRTWKEAAPLTLLKNGDLDGAGVPWIGDAWTGLSDPAVAWDDVGNAYLIGLMWASAPTATDPYAVAYLGMAAYKSTDGGWTWSPPTVIHKGDADKQWAAGDLNPASPHHGNVYAAWDGAGLAFARTTDHGATWTGAGGQPAGASITNQLIYPEINVSTDGTVYIFGLGNDVGPAAIKFVKSTDGGQTFSAPAVVASGVTVVPGKLPGGKFRLETLPTGCCGLGKNILCAWPDYREGVARIYYNRSNNGGNSWQGSPSGDPLLTGPAASGANQHDFMPQIVSAPSGEIGCAFYEFGPKGASPTPLIDVVVAISTDRGFGFPYRTTVTDQAWDPTVDEVWVHGVPTLTFIGDYFGFDASINGFYPFWTDTRTGIQELFTDVVQIPVARVPPRYEVVAQILVGIINDAGGLEIVGGHLKPVPPWGPEMDILLGIASHRIATLISDPQGRTVEQAAMNLVRQVAITELQRLESRQSSS